ncbi:MAG TPA: phosphoenolpyruvate--protein phosphotransferase [Pyrinomonadaceae bacterium]|nr:phosphoenolpyruvate--protein phosphotransferase [Pyrinomonadaceae bacterium]
MGNYSEVRLHGSSVSRGLASGRAVCLYGKRRQFFHSEIATENLFRETRRFRAAVRLAIRQLDKLTKNEDGHLPDNAAGILDFHRAVLTDEAMLDAVEQKITAEHVNAEWAVKVVTDSYLAQYKNIPDERLRERHIDLEDVADRILTALGGGNTDGVELKSDSVIVAHELNPSTLIELSRNAPAAIVTEQGSWTSHTNILARELGIPAVTGIKGVYRRIKSGDEVIVNGSTGDVIARPAGKASDMTATIHGLSRGESSATYENDDLQTLDGRKIIVRANADLAGRYESAKAAGARGIGLFRSEYIFNSFHGLPDEETQYQAYRRVAELAGKDGVRIRTFDIGVDALFDQDLAKGKNPALGLRAIRLSLERPEGFRTQLRAILRASHETSIDIILPMISDIDEIRRAKVIIEEERAHVQAADFQLGNPRLGVMIEVPSAVFVIDKILDEADILCLGTNDLVQYLLAVDRDNEAVSKWFNSLHPAVITAIKTVLEAANDRKKSCVVCGEMAGSPYYVPLLIGLGATELSMNPTSIARVSSIISGIAYEEALSLANQVKDCDTAPKAEKLVGECIRTTWNHLFTLDRLPFHS